MKDCFDISFIIPKEIHSDNFEEVLTCLGISKGECILKDFPKNKAHVDDYSFDDNDYIEISISISNLYFHKETFNSELYLISKFINQCVKIYNKITYALCSYELNGYLLGGITKMQEFEDPVFLCQFPIVYSFYPKKDVIVNLNAQDIFI